RRLLPLCQRSRPFDEVGMDSVCLGSIQCLAGDLPTFIRDCVLSLCLELIGQFAVGSRSGLGLKGQLAEFNCLTIRVWNMDFRAIGIVQFFHDLNCKAASHGFISPRARLNKNLHNVSVTSNLPYSENWQEHSQSVHICTTT